MTGSGFPLTPTGSPGAVEGIAASLTAANAGFREAASALKQTSSGLGGISWSGPAEARFSAAAAGLASATSTYHGTLGDVSKGLRSYAHALQIAQKTIDAARADYEAAKAAQADAATVLGTLGNARASATDAHERTSIAGRIDDQRIAADSAAHSAELALARATKARGEFDRAQDVAIGVLQGRANDPWLRLLPASPLFPLTPPAGAAFGVPASGLGDYSGAVPWDDLEDVDPHARAMWLDGQGIEPVPDLEIALSFIGGGIGLRLVKGLAGRLLGRTATTTVEEQTATRAVAAAEQDASRIEARTRLIEGTGELLDKGGVPMADTAGKVIALGVHPAVRPYIEIQFGATLERIGAMAASAQRRIAALRAAAVLHQGTRRGIPKEAIERLEQITRDAMRGGPRGR